MNEQDIWVEECKNNGYFPMIAGKDAFPFSVTFPDAPSSPVVSIYKKDEGSDLTATLLSGSNSVSGNTVTTKTLTPPITDAGATYIMDVGATVGGNTVYYKIRILVFGPDEG